MKMLINKWRICLLTVLLTLFFIQPIQADDYIVGTNDILQIKVYGYDELTTSARVSESGHIVFPLLGEIAVAGQSEIDIARKIKKLLAQGNFIQNANINVTVSEYRNQQVSVLGQVKNPGLYALSATSTLTDMIAMAGGIDTSGADFAVITRQINNKPIKQEVNLRSFLETSQSKEQTFIVQGGDIIYIPKAPMFYIHGEVQKPGSFPIEPNMTVSQAISLGGGLTVRGTFNGIIIERRDANGVSQEIDDVELSDKVLKDDVIIVDERLF